MSVSMNKVCDRLYLGNLKAASDLANLKKNVSQLSKFGFFIILFVRELLISYKWLQVLNRSFQMISNTKWLIFSITQIKVYWDIFQRPLHLSRTEFYAEVEY